METQWDARDWAIDGIYDKSRHKRNENHWQWETASNGEEEGREAERKLRAIELRIIPLRPSFPMRTAENTRPGLGITINTTSATAEPAGIGMVR